MLVVAVLPLLPHGAWAPAVSPILSSAALVAGRAGRAGVSVAGQQTTVLVTLRNSSGTEMSTAIDASRLGVWADLPACDEVPGALSAMLAAVGQSPRCAAATIHHVTGLPARWQVSLQETVAGAYSLGVYVRAAGATTGRGGMIGASLSVRVVPSQVSAAHCSYTLEQYDGFSAFRTAAAGELPSCVPRAACAAAFTAGECVGLVSAVGSLVQCGQPVRAGGAVQLFVSPKDEFGNPTVTDVDSLEVWLAHDVASVRADYRLVPPHGVAPGPVNS